MLDWLEIPEFALNWLLIVELVVLGVMGVMALVGAQLAKQDPDDAVFAFCRTFWTEFLFPPQTMSATRTARSGGGGARRTAPKQEPTDADAFYGRFPKDAAGRVQKADLAVLVEPHAASDAVVGRDGDGIRIQVVGEAGESRSNKALVEMVANAVGVKPFQVTLTKGHYQNRKTVQIQGVSPDELAMRLSGLAEAE